MVRVLHVIPTFGGGGAERQIVLLAQELSRLKIDVHIAYMSDGPNSDRARESGACIHRLEVRGNHSPRALVGLLSLINKRVRPTVVQTWLLHADVFGGLSAKLSRVPWVLSERASRFAYVDGWKNAIRRNLGQRAEAIVANSEAGLRYWREVGYKGTGVVIRNIVEESDRASPTNGRSQTSGVVGMEAILIVGRLAEQKNPMGVLDVLERVFLVRANAQAHFLGVGPMENHLKKHVAASSTLRDRVQFLGFVEEVEPWFRSARVCFSLSRFEGTPNAVLEAMRYGCPLVVSDIPEHLELLDSTSAWIAPLNDLSGAAAVLTSALSDPLEAKKRSVCASARLSKFNANSIAQQYVELYSQLDRRN